MELVLSRLGSGFTLDPPASDIVLYRGGSALVRGRVATVFSRRRPVPSPGSSPCCGPLDQTQKVENRAEYWV